MSTWAGGPLRGALGAPRAPGPPNVHGVRMMVTGLVSPATTRMACCESRRGLRPWHSVGSGTDGHLPAGVPQSLYANALASLQRAKGQQYCQGRIREAFARE